LLLPPVDHASICTASPVEFDPCAEAVAVAPSAALPPGAVPPPLFPPYPPAPPLAVALSLTAPATTALLSAVAFAVPAAPPAPPVAFVPPVPPIPPAPPFAVAVLEASVLVALALAAPPAPPGPPGLLPVPFVPDVPAAPFCVTVSAPLGTDHTVIAAARAIDTRAYLDRFPTDMDSPFPFDLFLRTHGYSCIEKRIAPYDRITDRGQGKNVKNSNYLRLKALRK
jgi:hypothetical protein